jgi:hypothetical protein
MAEAVHQFRERGAGDCGLRRTRAAQVVRVQTGDLRRLTGARPAWAELRPSERVTLRAGEQQGVSLGPDVLRQMVLERSVDEINRPTALASLLSEEGFSITRTHVD